MKRFVLPERWVVKATTDEEDEKLTVWMNKTYNTSAGIGIGRHDHVWFSNEIIDSVYNKHYSYSEYVDNSFIEITYNQFLRHVLSEIVIDEPEDNTELNEILIKLLS